MWWYLWKSIRIISHDTFRRQPSRTNQSEKSKKQNHWANARQWGKDADTDSKLGRPNKLQPTGNGSHNSRQNPNHHYQDKSFLHADPGSWSLHSSEQKMDIQMRRRSKICSTSNDFDLTELKATSLARASSVQNFPAPSIATWWSRGRTCTGRHKTNGTADSATCASQKIPPNLTKFGAI